MRTNEGIAMAKRLAVAFAMLATTAHGASLAAYGCGVEELRARVVAQDSADYTEARAQWASKMSSTDVSADRLSPQFIAFCKTDDHVKDAIDFAVKCNYTVSVRSGGHQYAGLSSCAKGTQCFQLDVSGLETFSWEPSTNRVTLGVGLVIEQVWGYLTPLNLAIPMGICNSVGVGGHFQSSSQGFLGRSFGLGFDHVVSFRIVLASGETRTVTADSDPELYWAVLGGSPGSWGVVLDYTINAIPANDYPHTQLMLYAFPYSHDVFVKISNRYLKLMQVPEFSRDLFILLVVGSRPPDKTYIFLQALWTGIDNGPFTDAMFAQHMQPFLDIAEPLPPPLQLNMKMPLTHAMNTVRVDFDYGPLRYHVHSMSANNFLDEEFVDKLADELDERIATPGMFVSFQFQPYGGTGEGRQVNRNTGKNSFPVRDIKMHIDDWVFFAVDALSQVAEQRIEGFRESSRAQWEADGSAESSWMTTSTYSDHDHEDRFKAYFPSSSWFHRLQAAKTEVDPSNVFSSPMTIPPKKQSGGKPGGGDGNKAEACDGQGRFNIMMCKSYMCNQCTQDFCRDKCQEVQHMFPTCRCDRWPSTRKTYSGIQDELW